MMKWWKKIFGSDQEDEIEISNNDEDNSQAFLEKVPTVHTKMLYQYPERKPCRFPVIPDRREEKRKSKQYDEPLIPRKYEVININKSKRQKKLEETNQGEVKQKEKAKQPFRPTQFASPIYGYQQRKELKEIDTVPTFIRNKKNEDKTTEMQNEDRKIENKKAVLDETFTAKEIKSNASKQEREEVIEQSKNLPNDRIIEQEISEERDTSVESNKQTGISNEEKSYEEKTRKDSVNNRSVKTERKQVGKNEGERRVAPFNVMMTPRDKYNLERKRKREEEKAKRVQVTEKVSFPYHLLDDPIEENSENKLWVEQQQELLEQTLKHFNVRAHVVKATQGPAVTRFEVQPELGVKVSKVRNLSDDIKLNMAAKDIRIEAPIPGKNAIGIEVPNLNPQMVGLQEILETNAFKNSKSPLTVGLGLSVEGSPVITDIAKMPHGLIAGATGSGKSVCINTILISLLYKANHEDVKFLLIDPKMVELAPYNGLPHLISPVITDVKAATSALKWAVLEMEERYAKFVRESVRDINRYNLKMLEQNRTNEKMPFIVIVIDELADLMMAAPQDVEDAICRIAQKARACGIHLLLATQRPSVDVITGLIKANIPTRIAFSVSSQVDSRTIIDTVGAERLLGRGDMLFIENGSNKNVRIQGAFVSDDEIERVTNFSRKIAPPNYLFEQEQLLLQMETNEEEDELLEEVIQFVVKHKQASTSLLQRQFRIGYNRAARLIDSLEAKGIITGQNGSKPREVLLNQMQLEEILQTSNN